MADTRGYRCAIGADGKLYATFEAAGGNHIFRYSPSDVTKKVGIVGGDKYHEFYNSKSEHKTVFGRYEPATGAYLLGQQLCARLSSGSCNTVRARRGEIQADATGRVYIVGTAAAHLPLSFEPPGTGDYNGGAYIMVMSADFKKRLYLTRVAPQGEAMSVGVRAFAGKVNFAYGGSKDPAKTEFYAKSPLQPKPEGGRSEGFLAVFNAHPPGSAGPPASCGASPEKPGGELPPVPEVNSEPSAEPPSSDAVPTDAAPGPEPAPNAESTSEVSPERTTQPDLLTREGGGGQEPSTTPDAGTTPGQGCGCQQPGAPMSSLFLGLLCLALVRRKATKS